jgi:hypothetical protein
MYSNKLVTSLKANNKILREFKDTVYIPFGSEYNILLKNLHTTRAIVNIYIDGDNVVENGLVLDPGKEVELERAIRNGNLNEGNRFKFIERTSNIEQHRGIKLEDGLIRVEFQFEMPRIFTSIVDNSWNNKEWVPGHWRDKEYYVGGILRSVDYSAGENTRIHATSAMNTTLQAMNLPSSSNVHDGMATMDCNFNESGITVPGSKSEQKFQTTYIGALDPVKHTMIIKVLGETPDNLMVRKPVTVKSKPKCMTCGKQNKAVAKFCTECGTSLTLFG